MQISAYLNFNGDCEAAMRRYVEVIGGEVIGIFRNGDSPDPSYRMPGGDNLVMNMTVRLGNSVIMASDVPDQYYAKPAGFSVTIAPQSAAEAERVFAELSAGGEVSMPLGETFWAEKFAMFTDRHGTPFMINFEGNRVAA
ncbi:MAG: VOC family protein [Rhizobiaceae bacterium]